MRQGQRPLSRFQAQSADAQAQSVPDTSQPAAGDGDDDDNPMGSLLANWDSPDLVALIQKVRTSMLPTARRAVVTGQIATCR